MRISDWSSDVCSSDLLFSLQLSAPAKRGDIFDKIGGIGVGMDHVLHGEQGFTYHRPIHAGDRITITTTTSDIYAKKGGALEFVVQETRFENARRSEERREGQESVSTCRSRWSQNHYK